MSVSKEILKKFEKVRTADVSDAMDSLGLVDVGVMSPKMRPLWEGIRMVGLAKTVKLFPSSRIITRMSYEEYDKRLEEMCDNSYSFVDYFGEDQVWVVDAGGINAGLWGSHIVMIGMNKGVRGYVIDGTCRDSYEVKLEKAPVFATIRSCTHVIGRLQIGYIDKPIMCAGVVVRPGDVVIGDDDGVVVVPQEIADEVVDRALRIREKDKIARRKEYEKLGLPLDETVT